MKLERPLGANGQTIAWASDRAPHPAAGHYLPDFWVGDDPLMVAADEGIACAFIEILDARRFCLAGPDEGVPAFIVAIRSAGGDVIDFLSYRIGEPRRWWLLTGIADVLGERAIRRAAFHGSRLLLFETPLEWLQINFFLRQFAAVVLNWEFDSVSTLAVAGRIWCATPGLRDTLLAKIAQDRAPRFSAIVTTWGG